MRLRLVGYSGDRPPVPGTVVVPPKDPNPIPPGPVDPGGDGSPAGPLLVAFAADTVFHKADYLALGYNRFEVMCIGGAGGQGQGFRQTYQDSIRHCIGAGGGGGGVHRVKGRLSLLPSEVPILVGAAGVAPAFIDLGESANPAIPALSDGGDGGLSSFGGVICRASGGKGGKKNAYTMKPPGGDGGVGNAGAAGGNAGEGKWDGTIGSGGVGGWGATFANAARLYNGNNPPLWPSVQTMIYYGGAAEAGMGYKGAYSADEPTTSGPEDPVKKLDFTFTEVYIDYSQNPAGVRSYRDKHDYFSIVPGMGGGAKTFLLNGDNEIYGSARPGSPFAHPQGIVLVRLTYVVV